MKLLFVEDDAELARQVLEELSNDGYDIRLETNGSRGLEAAVRGGWDIAILDVTLPGFSGFDIVDAMREEKIDIPVIFLTAKSDVSDRVHGLSLGGDDYLTKPFSMDELRARLQALTRRYSKTRSSATSLPSGWKLEPLLREVVVDGKPVSLQPREWSLLRLCLEHEGEVLTNSFLLDQVWDIQFDPGTNVINSTICRLRKKLDRPEQPSHFETLRGRGYVFRRHD
ncbi:MAG: response regulator transcription factor [Verrucomicrobiae bacterium]|nr:response regulator transcription factor [Verrucomicrobiae bacterium]